MGAAQGLDFMGGGAEGGEVLGGDGAGVVGRGEGEEVGESEFDSCEAGGGDGGEFGRERGGGRADGDGGVAGRDGCEGGEGEGHGGE